MTTVVSLPDDVAALLEERAAQQGITVADLICELAQLSVNRQALEAFIGCADVPVEGSQVLVVVAAGGIVDGLG